MDCAPHGACPTLRSGLFRPLRGLHIELAFGSVRPLCHLSVKPNCRIETAPIGGPVRAARPPHGLRASRRLPYAALRVVPAAAWPAHRARLRLGSTTLPPLR
jgi:hypothetical protein